MLFDTNFSHKARKNMTSNDSSLPPKRRAGTRSVNYSEKDADADLVRRIDHLEKVKNQTRINQGKPNKIANGKVSGVKSYSGTAKSKHQKFLNDKSVRWNFIPSLPAAFKKTSRFSNILDLKDSVVDTSENTLKNPHGILLKANDTIYMVSEPPGEPYYIGRVVEFVVKPEFRTVIDELKQFTKEYAAKYFQVKMNWFYRARDIQENVAHFDTRLVYASLHQDVCPIISYRGKCRILHTSEVASEPLDKAELLAKPNIFYFNQLFDRYSLQYYDVQSTDELLSLDKSSPFLCALNKRFRYIFMEERYPLDNMLKKYVLVDKSALCAENYHSWDNRCTVCREWCPSNQSLKCDECHSSVHLFCMDPPLDRKPNKGVIWICFNCLKRQEGTAEALRELKLEEEKQSNAIISDKIHLNNLAKEAIKNGISNPPTNYWFQYMGEHMLCHMEDLLHSEFYIPYPFKISRTGMKYQWTGSTDNEDWKLIPYSSDETSLDRGTSCTSELLWTLDDKKITETALDRYIETCKAAFSKKLEIVPESCNFLDMIVKALITRDYDQKIALSDCESLLSRDSLREPTFTSAEIEKFENAVAKYGSELHLVCKDVGTQSMSMIVRFYYYWKKTLNGKTIWGGFKGRSKNKGKNRIEGTKDEVKAIGGKPSRERNPTKLILENRNGASKEQLKFMDDSCFDTENMALVKTCFKCVFCEIDYSPLWYKITGGSDDEHVKHRMQAGVTEKPDRMRNHERTPENGGHSKEKNDRLDALCIRCARLWRRYGTKWQPPLDVFKRLNGSSMHILNTNLDRTFEETNANILTIKPEQARSKLVEWELVIDTEFIIRQRLNLVRHPENIPKLKAGTLASRSALYKLVKKPFDSDDSSAKNLLNELQNLLTTMIRKKLKATNNAKKVNEKGSKITNGKSVRQMKPDSNNPKTGGTPPVLNVVNYGIALSTNGDIQIDIPCANGVIGELLVNNDFESITVNSVLMKQLISIFPKRYASQKDGSSSDAELQHKLKRKGNEDLSSPESSFAGLNIINVTKTPKIVHESCTAALLEAYHSYNDNTSPQISKVLSSTDAKVSDTMGIERRDFCAVCRKGFADTPNEQLVCDNCGINVHSYCYGVDFDSSDMLRSPRDFKWLCDPCSNELNPIESTNYSCTLCYSKNRDCDSVKSQHNGACREALKCTTVGTWVHVACALFNENLKFGSKKSLQPVINSRSVILRNVLQKCALCSSEGGGLVDCDLCCKKFHVTCAQNNPSFDLLFKRTNRSSHGELLSGTDTYNSTNKQLCSLKPVFLCDIHRNEALKKDIYLPLSAATDDTARSLMQQYTSRHLDQIRHSMVYERYLEQRALTDGDSTAEERLKAERRSEILQEKVCDAQLGHNRFKDIRKLFESLPKQIRVELQTRDFVKTDLPDHTSSALGVARSPLSETDIDMLTRGIDPSEFDIKNPSEFKDRKKRKVTKKRVVNK